MSRIEDIYKEIKEHYQSDELVMGEGKPGGILLVGEAPGKDEVRAGRPFYGRAGQNLNRFLELLGLKRDEIYISNVCKFRPVKISEKGTVSNRAPKKEEILEALPFLREEIRAIAPQVIVTLGNTPLRACAGDFSLSIGDCHGRVRQVDILDKIYSLFALYHPASIIYNRALEPAYRDDLEQLETYARKNVKYQ